MAGGSLQPVETGGDFEDRSVQRNYCPFGIQTGALILTVYNSRRIVDRQGRAWANRPTSFKAPSIS
jgi:hypothetical protein